MNATKESPRNTTSAAWRKPIYRVLDGRDAHEVRVELPGVPKTGVSIRLEDGVLTVHGRREPVVPTDSKPLHREIPAEDFLLRLRLNTPVDEDRLEARLEQGVLSLRLPLRETARPRRIEIQ
jgi:HSP20 family protein